MKVNNTHEINQNALIAKINVLIVNVLVKNVKISKIDKKQSKKYNKFLLKRLQMFYIFWANILK